MADDLFVKGDNKTSTDDSRLIVSPNPSSEYINLNIENEEIEWVIAISMENLKYFHLKIIKDNTFDVSNLKAGVYLIKVKTKNHETINKIIIIN